MHATSFRWAVVALLASIYSASANNNVRLDARNATDHQQQLQKRDSGRATFFDVGQGACGWTNVASDFIVALNYQQFDAAGSGYPSPICGRGLTIYYNGRSSHATVADRCPSCGWGDLDLSVGLFSSLADTGLGTFQMSWNFDGDSSNPAPSPTPDPSPSPSPTPSSSSTQQSSTTSQSSGSSTPTSTSSTEYQRVFAAAPKVVLNIANLIMKGAHDS